MSACAQAKKVLDYWFRNEKFTPQAKLWFGVGSTPEEASAIDKDIESNFGATLREVLSVGTVAPLWRLCIGLFISRASPSSRIP